MASFFQAIRGYFKSDYDGRYLALLLREIALHEPHSIAALIDLAFRKSSSKLWPKLRSGLLDDAYVVDCEVPFGEGRRADLAFLSGREPRLLLEVKEYDDVNPKNDRQIDDYLIQADRGIGFIYIYRFNPQQKYYQRLLTYQRSNKPVATISYDEIYRAFKTEDAPLANLFCKYMEDIGVGVYRELGRNDGRHLSYLLVQLLGFPHQTGMGKLQSDGATRNIPKFFEIFLGNVEIIGESVRRANMSVFPQRFNRRFFVEPEINFKKLRKGLDGDELDDVDTIDSGLIEGGYVYFAATGSLNVPNKTSKEWGYRLALGFAVGLEKGSKKVSSYIYGQVEGYGRLRAYEELELSTIMPNEDVALSIVGKVIVKLQKKVLANKKLTAPARRAFQQLKAPNRSQTS